MTNMKSAQGRSALGGKPISGKPKIIILLGPTASGKSDLAVKLAQRFSGEVISADSRQVYRGLNIGAGKITKREMVGVPHYLLDVADPKRVFTVDQYQKLAKQAIKDILGRGHLPIVCGGTGLYIEAVVFDQNFPAVPPNRKLRQELAKLNPEQLFQKLQTLDPERAATIEAKNPVRLIRALEIVEALGQVPKLVAKTSPYDCLWLGLKPSDRKLAQNIHLRLLKRLKQGLVAEVKKLHQTGLSWKRLEALGLEYRYVAMFLQGNPPTGGNRVKMTEQLEKAIRHFARRQMTWFRHLPEVKWLKNQNEASKLTKEFLVKN